MDEKDYSQVVMKVWTNFIVAQTHPQKQENPCRVHNRKSVSVSPWDRWSCSFSCAFLNTNLHKTVHGP